MFPTSSSISSLSSCCSHSPLYSLKGQVYAWRKARVLVHSDCRDETPCVRNINCRSLSSHGVSWGPGVRSQHMVVCFRISDSTFLSVLMFQRASTALFWEGTNWGPAPPRLLLTSITFSALSPNTTPLVVRTPLSLSSKVRAFLLSVTRHLVICHFCALNPGS